MTEDFDPLDFAARLILVASAVVGGFTAMLAAYFVAYWVTLAIFR